MAFRLHFHGKHFLDTFPLKKNCLNSILAIFSASCCHKSLIDSQTVTCHSPGFGSLQFILLQSVCHPRPSSKAGRQRACLLVLSIQPEEKPYMICRKWHCFGAIKKLFSFSADFENRCCKPYRVLNSYCRHVKTIVPIPKILKTFSFLIIEKTNTSLILNALVFAAHNLTCRPMLLQVS